MGSSAPRESSAPRPPIHHRRAVTKRGARQPGARVQAWLDPPSTLCLPPSFPAIARKAAGGRGTSAQFGGCRGDHQISVRRELTPAPVLATARRAEAAMQNVKERVALTSIFASGGLTVAKAVVGVASGSLAILSEAAHSLLDLAATIMTYFAVRISGKPADAEHHFGHGKVESVSALAETALLFLLSGV